MVTFNEHITYEEALRKGRAQDKAMLNLIDDGKLPDSLSLQEKLKLVKRETKEIMHDDSVVKNLK